MTKASPPKGNKSKSVTKPGVLKPPVQDTNVTDVSFNGCKESQLEERVALIEAQFNARIDELHKILSQKDTVIGNLNREIGELKKSYDFLSNELSVLKKSQEESEVIVDKKLKETNKALSETILKTTDLEDRSRRSNLVFFNIAEATHGTIEDCEEKVVHLIDSLNVAMPNGEGIYIDRAHRLGRRTPECSTKPRPIIVKFTYYKQKQFILKNGYKFKNSHVNMSEDFSRETLQVHKKLHAYGKHAANVYDDPMKSIKHFKINSRQLVITYNTNKNDPGSSKFIKSFDLENIQSNPYWFKPQVRRLDSD